MNEPIFWLIYHHSTCALAEEALDPTITRWIGAHARSESWAQLVDAVDAVDIGWANASELPVLGRERLLARGMGVEEAAVLDRADRVLIVTVGANWGPDHLGLRAGLAVSRAIAAATGGVIYDETRMMLLPLDTCDDPLQEGERLVLEHMRVEASHFDHGGWVTTNGMRLFGAPELELDGVGPHQLADAAGLLRFTAMSLVTGRVAELAGVLELPSLQPEIPSVSIELSLLPSARNGAAFLRVHPPGAPDQPLGEHLDNFGKGVIDPVFSTLVSIPLDDPEVQHAVEQSIRELPAVRQRYRSGLGAAVLLLRVEVTRDGESESLWVEVEAWTRKVVKGRLTNLPTIPGFAPRQRVKFRPSEIRDWLIEHEDGRKEGGRTNEVLRARAAEMRALTRPSPAPAW